MAKKTVTEGTNAVVQMRLYYVDEIIRQLRAVRTNVRATKREIDIVFLEYLRGVGYKKTFSTKLYTEYSPEYCSVLEIINNLNLSGSLDFLLYSYRVKS